MKKFKNLGIVMVILALLFTIIACDDDPCNCNPKDHLGIGETCCGGKGCKCELKDYTNAAGIPFYRMPGVMDTEAEVIAGHFTEIYNVLDATGKTNLKKNVTEVHVTSTGSVSGTKGDILYIPKGATEEQIGSYLAINAFFIAQLQQKGIRLADGFQKFNRQAIVNANHRASMLL